MSETYVVIFLLGQDAYCIPVSAVQEIQGYHALSPPRQVPDTPASFEGIIDLRGQVIPVLDLKQRLGIGVMTPSRKTCYIIVDSKDEKIGLLVDTVVEVQRVGDYAFQDPPARLKMVVKRDYVLGVGKLASRSTEHGDEQKQGERLVILLDIEQLINFPADN